MSGRLRKRIGKPGSRKYHRWENDRALGRREGELSDTGPLSEDEMNSYLFEGKHQNIFYQMFENPELLKSWQPFLDITEEEERLLRNLDEETQSDDDNTRRHGFYSRSHVAFEGLTSEGRKSLVKYSETTFLEDLDGSVIAFINGKFTSADVNTNDLFSARVDWQKEQLVLEMKDSFHRLMAHSVCSFYNATSFSELNEQGKKIIKVSPPLTMKYTPSQSLTDYLKSLSTDVKYWTTSTTSETKKKTKKKSKSSSRKRSAHRPTFTNEQSGWLN